MNLKIAVAALAVTLLTSPSARADDADLCADKGHERDYTRSIAACDRLLGSARTDAERARIHVNRSVRRNQSGDRAGADADTEAAVRLDPDNPTARVNGLLHRLARDRRDRRERDAAVAELDRMVAERPSFAFGFATRAFLKMGRNDLVGALADADVAIRLEPGIPLYHRHRAQILDQMGRRDEALAEIGRCLEIDPKDPVALRTRGAMFAERDGEFERAYTDFHEAAELAPNDPSARLMRGLAAYYDDAPALALREIRAAAEIDPTAPYPALWLELMLRKAGQPGELASRRGRLKTEGWPAPIIQVVLGEITPAELGKMIRHPEDPRKEAEESCESAVFVSAMEEIAGRPERAKRGYALGRRDCPIDFVERTAAFMAIRQLGK